MRIAQYQLVTAVLVPAFAALAPAPAVHAADGLTGSSPFGLWPMTGPSGHHKNPRSLDLPKKQPERCPRGTQVKIIWKPFEPISWLRFPVSALQPSPAYGVDCSKRSAYHDDDDRTPQQQMIAFSVLAATGSSATLLDLAERILGLDADTATWKSMAMCQTLSKGITKATTLDLAERNRSDLARMLGRIAPRMSLLGQSPCDGGIRRVGWWRKRRHRPPLGRRAQVVGRS